MELSPTSRGSGNRSYDEHEEEKPADYAQLSERLQIERVGIAHRLVRPNRGEVEDRVGDGRAHELPR